MAPGDRARGEVAATPGDTAESYFEQLYADDPDPWGFGSRWYEERKYRLTVAALPRPRYRRGFEPGCSIGVLTALLAERCDQLVAAEPVAVALDQARQRLAPLANVEVLPLTVPGEWPTGPFDLIVVSEIGYYFAPGSLARLIGRIEASLPSGGDLVAVHWRGDTDYPMTGDMVHKRLDDCPWLERTVHHLEADFVLDVWTRPGR
jgi:SAM-dependent methyltransferase